MNLALTEADKIAMRLCEEWQRSKRRPSGFSLDELCAFMDGVKATLAFVETRAKDAAA